DHRVAAVVALDAIFPSAETRFIFAELLDEGLQPHHVSEAGLFGSADRADTFVDICATLGLRIRALREHRSEMGDWVPAPMARCCVSGGTSAGTLTATSIITCRGGTWMWRITWPGPESGPSKNAINLATIELPPVMSASSHLIGSNGRVLPLTRRQPRSCVATTLDVLRLTRRQVLDGALAVSALLVHDAPPQTRCRSSHRILDARGHVREYRGFLHRGS